MGVNIGRSIIKEFGTLAGVNLPHSANDTVLPKEQSYERATEIIQINEAMNISSFHPHPALPSSSSHFSKHFAFCPASLDH